MNVLPKRIFINKLPESIRKPDLESKFSHYGKVVSVEILSRKNAFQENQPPFAYVNLETSDENLHRCIRDFANKQWKGEFLNVQIAKENFLSRLKREREEETKPKVEWSSKSHGADILNQPKIPLENGYKRKKVYFDQGEHNVTEETSRNNDNSLAVPTPYVQSRPVDEKKPELHQVEANEKRILSNIGMRNQYKQQKLLIRSALSNLDSKPKNKIIFDTEIPEQELKSSKSGKQLFNEDSDVEEELKIPDFALKEQFEGQSGRKLLELQSTYKNDRRFVLNETFLEKDEGSNHKTDNSVLGDEDEKQTQLNILEEVLGTKITPKSKNLTREKQRVMLRFNPEDPQHKAFEIKQQEEENLPTKKKKHKEMVETEEPAPEVSKTKFYKVTDSLKNVFQSENTPFTLLSSSKESEEADSRQSPETNQQVNETAKKKVLEFNGAFRDHTSDTSDEDDKHDSHDNVAEDQFKQKETSSDRKKFWSEPFFFQTDDYRFQEGLDFIKRVGSEESGDFLALRRNLKQVVRAKVRNVNRKNGMFKKKLGGGKKRRKIKKALKRT